MGGWREGNEGKGRGKRKRGSEEEGRECFEKRKRGGNEGELVPVVKWVKRGWAGHRKSKEKQLGEVCGGVSNQNMGFVTWVFLGLFLYHTYIHRPLTRHAV